jgi:ABC-type branched-subunit amino acid transport system permease subunit
VPVADTAVAMVLGVLLLVVVLGGLVWLDRGPIGRHGRTLRERRPPEQDPPDDDVSP